ncbi:MAG TPA: pilus assembly protein TadG-related protein, partial [Beijerinckiaceae bacterium]|nr:pilus assembly protein TadG-related protein [Beijerinckiaceae bacterium]
MSALPRLRDLLRNRNGSIAITFALSLVPMLGLSGAAVDYGRATNARAKLQAALDGIVLSLALQASEMAP